MIMVMMADRVMVVISTPMVIKAATSERMSLVGGTGIAVEVGVSVVEGRKDMSFGLVSFGAVVF